MRTVTYNPETFDHDVEQTRDWFRGRRNLLITTHLRPDGDALGSVFAATDCLRNEGIDCTPYLAEPLADRQRPDTPRVVFGIRAVHRAGTLAEGHVKDVEDPPDLSVG